MSVELGDMKGDGVVAPLTARAAAAWKRAPELLAATIDDYLLPPEARLDERDRAAITATLSACAGAVERAILTHAAIILGDKGETALVAALADTVPPAIERLLESKLARDPEFMREIIARSRVGVLAAALPLATQDAERASLLPRLGDDADPAVAAGARALLTCGDRRAPFDDAAGGGTGLPAELHHRLTWWIAAVIRERVPSPSDPLDSALADAALRALGEHDEGDRAEAAAVRLASLLGARDLLPLLVEALGDRQLALFLALVARGSGVCYDDARDALLDSAGDRLWLMLRALDCPRDGIARIGLALDEADGHRDIDTFADTLDEIMAITPEAARAALAGVVAA